MKSLIVVVFFLNILGFTNTYSNINTVVQSNTEIEENDSVIFIHKGKVLKGVAKATAKKKVVVLVNLNNTETKLTIRRKDIFKPTLPQDLNNKARIRFIYTNDKLAEDVILKGKILAANKDHFLLEFKINNVIQIESIHKSHIVQRDLKNLQESSK